MELLLLLHCPSLTHSHRLVWLPIISIFIIALPFVTTGAHWFRRRRRRPHWPGAYTLEWNTLCYLCCISVCRCAPCGMSFVRILFYRTYIVNCKNAKMTITRQISETPLNLFSTLVFLLRRFFGTLCRTAMAFLRPYTFAVVGIGTYVGV